MSEEKDYMLMKGLDNNYYTVSMAEASQNMVADSDIDKVKSMFESDVEGQYTEGSVYKNSRGEAYQKIFDGSRTYIRRRPDRD